MSNKKQEMAGKMTALNMNFSKADLRGQKKVAKFNSKFMDRSQKAAGKMKGYTERTKGFWVKNGRETEDSFVKAIKHREMLGDKLDSRK